MQDVAGMLAETRWRTVDVSERSRRAGLTVAAPVREPAAPGEPPTASLVGRYLERLYHRRAIEGIPRHLATAYGIEVNGIRQFDIGAFRASVATAPRGGTGVLRSAAVGDKLWRRHDPPP